MIASIRAAGVVVGGPASLVARRRRRDHLQRLAQVVEDEDACRSRHADLGRPSARLGAGAARSAHGVVASQPTAPPKKRGRPGGMPAPASPGSRRRSGAARRPAPSRRCAARRWARRAGSRRSNRGRGRRPVGARQRSCRRPTCRRRRRSPAGKSKARAPAWRMRIPGCRCRRRPRGTRMPAGRVGPGRGNQHDPGRNARAGHHTTPGGSPRTEAAKRGKRRGFGYHRRPGWRAPGPPSCITTIPHRHLDPARVGSSPGHCGTGPCSGWSRSCWRCPAAWRTVRLYEHLRSDVEELLPRDAPSVVAIGELRRRMAGLQYLGVMVDVGRPENLPAGERLLDDLAARVRQYPKTEVSDVRVGFAAEKTFVEAHAGSLIDLQDLRTIRQRIEDRLHWEYAKKTGTLLDEDEPAPALDFADIERKYAGQLGGGDLEGNRFSNRSLGLSLMIIEVGGFSTGASQARRADPPPSGRRAGAGRHGPVRAGHAHRPGWRRRHLGRGDGRAGPGPDALVGAGGGGGAAGAVRLLPLGAQPAGAVPAAGAGGRVRVRPGEPAAVPHHRAQLEHGVPGVDHHRQRHQLRDHPAGPVPGGAPQRPGRRGRAGDRAVGDPLGDAVGGDGGRDRLRVAGRDAVSRVQAVRRHRRPGDGLRVGDGRRADAAAAGLAGPRREGAAAAPVLGTHHGEHRACRQRASAAVRRCWRRC